MQEFLDMELEMMPAAIAWIGRPLPIGWEGRQVSGLSLLYNLTRRLPDLFDSNAQKKKSDQRRIALVYYKFMDIKVLDI